MIVGHDHVLAPLCETLEGPPEIQDPLGCSDDAASSKCFSTQKFPFPGSGNRQSAMFQEPLQTDTQKKPRGDFFFDIGQGKKKIF